MAAGVGVGRSRLFLPESESESESTKFTDSGQALIPDSQKSPCRLYKPFLSIFFVVTGWMMNTEPSPALFCIVEMVSGRNSGPRPHGQSFLYSWWGDCPTNIQVCPTNFVLCPNNLCQI